MSPLSAPVLGGAALLTAPALWGMVDGTTSPVVALTRFLICMGVLWVAFGFLEMLVGPVQQATVEPDGGATTTPDPDS